MPASVVWILAIILPGGFTFIFTSHGVSQLHGDILKEETFHDYNLIMPEKFSAITNGITHRRWLMSCNPELTKIGRAHV